MKLKKDKSNQDLNQFKISEFLTSHEYFKIKICYMWPVIQIHRHVILEMYKTFSLNYQF